MVTDPVCFKEMKEDQVEFCSEYRGQMYYFDSERCQEVFQENPDEYVGNIPTKVYGDHGKPQ